MSGIIAHCLPGKSGARYVLLALFLLQMRPARLMAQSGSVEQDRVPRARLVNNQELFTFLDSARPELAAVRENLRQGDTTAALHRLARYFKNRVRPRYFFAPAHVARRAEIFVKRYPREAQTSQALADEFMQEYGPDVDWKQPGRDLLGRPHTPNTVRFLARQARATDIAMSYFFKGQARRYLDFWRAQVRDFVADYEAGKTESGRNDVFERFYAGHRTRNWLFVHHLFLAEPAYTDQDHILMLKVFLLHGARLYDACKKFHYGNHQLHGLAGLYEMSAMYPEFPVMRFWNRRALEVIMQHIDQEINPDGFQFERASHYFKLDIINYFRMRRISELNGLPLPPLFEERFHRMFDAIVKLAEPDRTLPVLQDAQAVYRPQPVRVQGSEKQVESNDVAELAEPEEARFMSLGAVLFQEPRYKFFGSKNFPAQFYWFLPEHAAEKYAALEQKAPELGSVALDSTKYFVMRSGWSDDARYLIIDGGLARHKPDHTHGGVLGLIAFAFGEEILPNYRVRYSDPSFRTLKNSLVKNVALVDDVLQGQEWISNHSRTGFGIWKRLPQPQVLDWLTGEHFDYFRGTHNAFDSLGVRYERSIVFFRPDCWIVVDDFKSSDYHRYQQIWQGEYSIDDQYNRARQVSGSARLDILQADPARMEVHTRNNFGHASVQFEKRGYKNYMFLTLLYPQPAASSMEPEIRLFERAPYRQVVAFAGTKRYVLYFKKGLSFSLDEIETDARGVAVTLKDEVPQAVLLLEGTRLHFDTFTLEAGAAVSLELTRTATGVWEFRQLAGPETQIRLEQN